MNRQAYDSTESGYLKDSFEGISNTFTEVEVLCQTTHHLLARAKRYGRWWMLKTLQAEVAQQTVYQQMLRKELEMLMHLQHPYIVQTVGLEHVEGWGACIVMEYVDGMRLDEWLKTPQSKECRLKLTIELLEAVEYIHSMGMVHRDLKPGNILVTRNGTNIKLIDFGLADDDHIAILKQPAGTPNYISPEQAVHAVPDARNDIYSLGKIIQQLLPERSFKPIVQKCLRPIHLRYQNVTQLCAAVQNKSKRRQRFMLGIAVLLIAGLSIGWGIQSWKLQKQEGKRLRIQEAIKAGIEKVDRTHERAGVDHRLDTCTNFAYIAEDYQAHFMDGGNAANAYLDSIRPHFSPMEMSEIMTAVHIHVGDRLKRWTDKMTELTSKRMEP